MTTRPSLIVAGGVPQSFEQIVDRIDPDDMAEIAASRRRIEALDQALRAVREGRSKGDETRLLRAIIRQHWRAAGALIRSGLAVLPSE